MNLMIWTLPEFEVSGHIMGGSLGGAALAWGGAVAS